MRQEIIQNKMAIDEEKLSQVAKKKGVKESRYQSETHHLFWSALEGDAVCNVILGARDKIKPLY